MGDKIWFEDFFILFNKNRLIEFFPNKIQSYNERLNSIMRFCIYTVLMISYVKNDWNYIYIILIFGLIMILFYDKNLMTKPVIENFENNCVRPTRQNPFMNATMGDYLNIKDGKIVDRGPACDVTDPAIKKDMDEKFRHNLYTDVNDIFGKYNSQRQFYTMPSTTIPNDQEKFAKWLYGDMGETCKENGDYCNRYEDLRYKST